MNKKLIDQESKLISFLKEKERDDKEVHAYADSIKMNTHELEGAIYKIAHKALTGKYLKHVDDPDSNFDADELALGITVEHEHTGDSHIAKAITKAHLSEIPDYYTRLKQMEKTATARWLAKKYLDIGKRS